MRRIPIEDRDPPALVTLVLLGLVCAFAGLLAGIVLAITPLGIVGFVAGTVAAPVVAALSAWRQGTNGTGAAIAAAAGFLALAAIAWIALTSSVAP